MEMMEQFLTVPEAASLMDVTKSAIYEAIREERIKSQMVFGRRVILREEVAAYQKRTEGVGAKGGRPKIQRKRGRPRTRPESDPSIPKRPVGRPKKQVEEIFGNESGMPENSVQC